MIRVTQQQILYLKKLRNKKIIGLIPVRLNSQRLKKKALLDIHGLPMIVHTMKRAQLSKKLDEVIVCTDSHFIYKEIIKYGGNCLMTSKKHKNGTERIAEVARKIKADLYVDIQGDEPLINPFHIDKLISFHLKNQEYEIVVPYIKFKSKKNDKNIVKIVSSKNKVIYFSRSYSPFFFKSKTKFLKKHLSIISFKRKSLLDFSQNKKTYLEKLESIELMRAIENNQSIGTFELKGKSFSVDVKKNYLHVLKYMGNDEFFKKYK